MIIYKFVPQKFSRDLYVRLREHELYQLKLIHLYSEASAPAPWRPICGFTEWSGPYQDVTISMGWDWVLDSDGAPLYSTPQILRSNIMLISDKGYDIGPEMTSALCEKVVHATSWRSAVMTVLHH